MRTTITIDILEIGGINPHDKRVPQKEALDKLEVLMAKLCENIAKDFQRLHIKTKIVHVSE
jgi:hypothetical protein